MSKDTKLLIEELSRDLSPKGARLLSPNHLVLVWFSLFVSITLLLMTWRAPFRSNVFEQLSASPHFVFELLIAAIACICLTVGTIQGSVPGGSRVLGRIGILAAVLWAASTSIQLIFPAVSPSMLGKREHCYWEAFYYSVPAGLAMAWLVGRRYPLAPIANAIFAGFSVSIVPAVLMQYACMYDARHALTHHLLPALIGGVLIAIIVLFGSSFLKNNKIAQ